MNPVTKCAPRRASGALLIAISLGLGLTGAAQGGGLPSAELATGGFHTCAITHGALDCWGQNTVGQLGNGTLQSASRPFPVLELDRRVTDVAAGAYHTCALQDRLVFCWGENHAGQLGLGSVQNVDAPAPVPGLLADRIIAGGFGTCAITGGTIKCWGDNTKGQVGNGASGGSVLAPDDVAGLPGGVSEAAIGRSHACAVSNGGLYCWGGNDHGQLGLGNADANPHPTPSLVPGLETGIIAVAAGAFHTCAIDAAAQLYCWGWNDKGQLGDGTQVDRATPVPILSGVTAVTAGPLGSSSSLGSSTCAISAGGIRCWGYNAFGELGDGTLDDSHVPVGGPDLPNAVAISSGGSHACAQLADGRVACWGDDSSLQLGDGALLNVVRPMHSAPVDPWALLSAGAGHQCGGLNGGLVCWGSNVSGQLGHGEETLAELPAAVDLPGAPAVDDVAAGASHSCAWADLGQVLYCWGDNSFGQLGNGTTQASALPVEVATIGGSVTDVGAGAGHSCAVLQSGNVQCWGRGDSGQLGNFSLASSDVPVTVVRFDGIGNVPLSAASAVRAGGSHSCAIVDDSAMCWGANDEGQLGNATHANSARAVAVTGLATGVDALATHHDHSCAIVVVAGGAIDRGVRCWGANGSGQLGGGSTVPTTIPIQVRTSPQAFLDRVTALAVGREHSCALRDDGRVWCWGGNVHGQLGTGTFIESSYALEVQLPSGMTANELVAGDDFTCVKSAGQTWCWGNALDDRLGNGWLGYSKSALITDTMFHDDFDDD